ncbi:acid protease [Wolfiporia cocos MD-104 SS10]|uniref:Acid protease n=1 Tax=Wolfiporia cocos (strain MD-104) TaxID=742152 RepID=A0A2H3K1G9_WOLCO|nr:acid protease [Wolfiporia cocos MD-104 SS10]
MLLVPLLTFFVGSSHALNIPLERRAAPTHSTTVSINTNYNGNLGWTNDNDFMYTATVYVQGQPFQVQIDSGSSDLWINTENVTFKGLVETGIDATIAYVDTTAASGQVALANVSFGEFTVNGQAFINAPGSNASTPGLDQGLLGVGPPFASSVFGELYNTSYNGLPFLVNVFSLNPDEPNFITFLLSRSESNSGISEGGVMTIAELVSEYADITKEPKLPVVSDGSWETFMDGVYINGEFFTGHTLGAIGVTAKPGPYQTTIILDTGTSLATAPPYYVDAMYKNISGAKFSEDLQTYTLPCSTKLNISMVFGSSVYPMNPIDATTLTVNDDGTFYCQGTFSYSPATAGVDLILGDAFMRNVYSLMSYGSNFTGNGDEPPYMQIRSITDAEKAWEEFDALNLQRIMEQEYLTFSNATPSSEVGAETETFALVTPSATATHAASSATHAASHSSSAAPKSSDSADKDELGGDLLAAVASPTASAVSSVNASDLLRNTYIIMGLLGGVLLLLIAVLAKIVKSSRNPQYRQVSTVIPPAHFGKPYEPESEAFTTPYDDPARPLP